MKPVISKMMLQFFLKKADYNKHLHLSSCLFPEADEVISTPPNASCLKAHELFQLSEISVCFLISVVQTLLYH